MLQLRNPHSVLAALESRPGGVSEIRLSRPGAGGDAWEKVATVARKLSIPVHLSQAGRGEARLQRAGPAGRGRQSHPGPGSPDEGGRAASAEAIVQEKEPHPIETLFSNAPERAGGKGLWLALDSLQDPHNVGAIFRTAAFFGVQGIVLTHERSAPLTGTVYDVACGGIESVPFTLQTNLQVAFEAAREAGLWILGSSEHAQEDIRKVKTDRPWLLVIGNEEKGMRRLTEEACDVLCRISPSGQVGSLNASVAASILIARLTAGL